MIKLLRVDHRLIHGQTGVYWTSNLQADCILIASDTLLNDPIKLPAIKLSKPVGVKLVIKTVEDSIKAINSGVTDKYKLFIITEDVNYAFRLMKGTGIKSVNLGSMMRTDVRHIQVGDGFFVSESELKDIKNMVDEGYYLYLRPVPTDPEIDVKNYFKD